MNFFDFHNQEILIPKQHVLKDLGINYEQKLFDSKKQNEISMNESLLNIFNHC